jgi:hypothetical protein
VAVKRKLACSDTRDAQLLISVAAGMREEVLLISIVPKYCAREVDGSKPGPGLARIDLAVPSQSGCAQMRLCACPLSDLLRPTESHAGAVRPRPSASSPENPPVSPAQ